jgi:hypothetical protein
MSFKIRIRQKIKKKYFSRVADPHHFNAYLDQDFHSNADPDSDPAFHFNADLGGIQLLIKVMRCRQASPPRAPL